MAVIVRSSPLHGAGVYTTAPFKKGKRILEYTGPRLTKKQSEGMYSENEVTYLFAIDNVVIDGFGAAAFVNHSCDPSCETRQYGKRIFIVAERDIKAGEELTYDYNLFDGEPGELAPCYCGASKCRGTMFSDEEIARHKRILQRRKKKKQISPRRHGGAEKNQKR
jgi:SET domain-containing protein